MSHLECPSCGLRISALSAPENCPRCLVRGQGRVELVVAPMFAPSSDHAAPTTSALPDGPPIRAR